MMAVLHVFEDEHIIYAVTSILVLLTFVIPFPFVVIAISRNYFKVIACVNYIAMYCINIVIVSMNMHIAATTNMLT